MTLTTPPTGESRKNVCNHSSQQSLFLRRSRMTETAFVVICAIVNEWFQSGLIRSSREHVASLSAFHQTLASPANLNVTVEPLRNVQALSVRSNLANNIKRKVIYLSFFFLIINSFLRKSRSTAHYCCKDVFGIQSGAWTFPRRTSLKLGWCSQQLIYALLTFSVMGNKLGTSNMANTAMRALS